MMAHLFVQACRKGVERVELFFEGAGLVHDGGRVLAGFLEGAYLLA